MGKSTWKQALLLVVVVAVGYLPLPSQGHGRLRDPPSRSSLWRENSNSPTNYDDNGLNCGGYYNQWNAHGGRCGICGDPWQGPRHNEAGGRYANGIISRNYVQGHAIEVKVEITAHHKGWFEFRICPNNDVNTPASQACLNQYLLPLANQHGVTRYQLPEGSTAGWYTLMLQLPQYLTCQQCVFQWKYHAGNNWGCEGGTCGLGYGPQEEFYGCADVTITGRHGGHGGHPAFIPRTTHRPRTPTWNRGGHGAAAVPGTCRAAPGPWYTVPGLDNWCVINCAAGNCPPSHCTCD